MHAQESVGESSVLSFSPYQFTGNTYFPCCAMAKEGGRFILALYAALLSYGPDRGR